MDTITPLELEAMLTDRIDVVLVNVMNQDAFTQERIPRSFNLPMSDEDFAERLEQLAGGRDATIVVYGAGEDSAGIEAATGRLSSAGFTDVMHLEGGIEGWVESGLEVESGDV
jgi:rhodanese-related sulfurtransferase